MLADLPPPPTPGRRDAADRRRRPAGGAAVTATPTPGPDWQPTSERFRDPRTNKVMRVWVDAGGGRHYVADDYGRHGRSAGHLAGRLPSAGRRPRRTATA